jgi:hypothetical protein
MSGYNGWRNYATWAAFTWATHDEPVYRYFAELARESGNDFAAELKFFFDGVLDNHHPEPSLFRHILATELATVDWTAIAEHFTEPARH